MTKNPPQRSAPWLLSRLEGAGLAILGIWCFALSGESWWLFAALILIPDLGLLGYLVGPKTGATAYNALHTLVGPVILGCVGLGLASGTTMAVAWIWATHIGVDRLVGYGLKYQSEPRVTHLQRL